MMEGLQSEVYFAQQPVTKTTQNEGDPNPNAKTSLLHLKLQTSNPPLVSPSFKANARIS